MNYIVIDMSNFNGDDSLDLDVPAIINPQGALK